MFASQKRRDADDDLANDDDDDDDDNDDDDADDDADDDLAIGHWPLASGQPHFEADC